MNDADYKINSFLKQEIKVVQELKGNLLNSTPGFPFDHEMEGSLNMFAVLKTFLNSLLLCQVYFQKKLNCLYLFEFINIYKEAKMK